MKKTVYKPWTENTCPLKVGDVLWDPLNKREVMVTVRMHSENKDDPQANLIVLGDCPYSGQELLDFGLECWDNYPDKTTSFKCCEAHLVEEHWVPALLSSLKNMLDMCPTFKSNELYNTFVKYMEVEYCISLVIKAALALKEQLRIDFQEPEDEWFWNIDKTVLRYANDYENNQSKDKEKSDVED